MSNLSSEIFLSDDKNVSSDSKVLQSALSEIHCLSENDKSEHSIDAFSSKRKIEDEFDSVVSPWEFRRLKADLCESQAQRIKLEDRIEELHKKNKEAVIFFDKEKSEMKNQLESNRVTIKTLEFRLNKIRKREVDYKEELNAKLQKYECMTEKLSDKIQKLEKENKELKENTNKFECDLDNSKLKYHEEINNLKSENEKLKIDNDEKNELCSSLNARLVTASEKAKKLEDAQSQLQLAQLKIKALEFEQEEFKEAKNVTLALSEKVLRVNELEKELNEKKLQISNLKQFLHNNILLEEMVHDLKIKLAANEKKVNEIPGLKGQIMQLELDLDKWKSLASEFCSDVTISSLRSYIESLQQKEINNVLEINNLNTLISSLENKCSTTAQQLEISKIQNQKLETIIQKLKVGVQLLKKKTILVSRERDSYRQQLDLYERDLTITDVQEQDLNTDVENRWKSRIKSLEVTLSEYQNHIESLELQLKQYQTEGPSESIDTIFKLKEEIKKLEDSNKSLRKIKDELERKIESKALIEKTTTDSNTKILHFKENPASIAEKDIQKEMDYYQKECERLRSRVKLLESGETLNITQKVTEDIKSCNSQKVLELEKELQSANLKMQRLKEVFKKTSQEFRDVSYMLLGYRIDLTSNNKLYKLYNMYSTSQLDYLMFQQTKNGTLEMLGTTFAESMSKFVDEYLHSGNSIPAFLSAITLELYRLNGQSDEDDNEEDYKRNLESDSIVKNFNSESMDVN
ncbi:mitotic spindle assembly checkpoint protein MAD1, putative [Pediculus humanus corporis]|uniref:Mitotic spindle assembly checkpoint protein MAD1, putative n=1 Tax=Pediculus humanus subsp. corporis TaxID=121224 RepID=E0VR23_PEDHC|nr:mitotic spindle assembly checkpoint protein MAD1, putative [Pediculus humanus corporis]EEB15829.1 mitotic spindle assembly checkpoint protein MAD1, putative [Pediculus humanus corporis]